MHRPQRRGDQVIPAAMPAGSALPGDITRGPDPDPGAAHRPGKHSAMERQNLALLIVMVLCGAPGPSPEINCTISLAEHSLRKPKDVLSCR